ncbi:MAG: ABC transporter permease [Chitinophagaceae bacterium]
MIKNYFKIAWRNLLKNKAFSFINIMGLSIGISVCFIIMLFVQDELSYDRFNVKADRMYRIAFRATMNGGKINESNVMPPVAAALKNDYPEVEEVTRINEGGKPKVTYQNKTFKDGLVALVDSNFFNVFTIPLIVGDKRNAVLEPYSVVLTKKYADKLFGNEDPIGKLIRIGGGSDSTPCKVTGIINEVPRNSHFHFDLFVSLSSLPYSKDPSWMSSGMFTYVVLKQGYDYKKLEAKFPGMVEKYMGPQIQKAMGLSLSQFRTKGNDLGFILMPLTKIHMGGFPSNYEMEPPGDIRYVYIFGAVAIFMLLIACINFINLSTASASKRAKEVGVRKVMGSAKTDLIKQFLFESGLITFIALLISSVLVQIALPVFNNLSGKNLVPGFSIGRVAGILALGLLVSILAGLYPAFFLSSFKPIATLKGRLSAATKSYGLRSSLVVFQFFISVSLITGTIVVYQQMKFIREKKLGYDKDQILVIGNSWQLGKNERILRDELLADTRVANVTISSYKPAGWSDNNNALGYPEGQENRLTTSLEYNIDERYIPTFGMQMAAGRNFSKDFSTDSTAMIINESAVKAYGYKNNEDALGKRIIRQNSVRGTNIPFTVIGVVKDFNFKSLHEAITPLLMVLNPGSGLLIKTKTKDVAGLLATIKKRWQDFGPEDPMDYAFLNDQYNKTYSAEQTTGTILNIFAILTILVACLGLFGLATYTAEQRAKEIGIRKVLGASVAQVTTMLSKEFVKLVLIACVIAFPLSYWAMSKWLQDFAYRINIGWAVFVIAGLLALFIALSTVSFRAIKAALANPVKSLRTE